MEWRKATLKPGETAPRSFTTVPSGAGGGKGGAGGTSGGTEAPNTLNSRAQVLITDLISEGPIAGLVNGASSIYVNNTPLGYVVGGVQSYNYYGFGVALMGGFVDQNALPGPADVEDTYVVGAQVKLGQPVTREVQSSSADAVRVTLMIPQLVSEDSTGDLNPTTVRILWLVQANDQGYYIAIDDTITGKTTTQFEQDYYIPLPAGGYPWHIQMVRLTADSTLTNLANDTYFAQITEVIENRCTYPNSAVMGCIFDAQSFGGQLPGRAYEIYGRTIAVPTNYDPPTRSYTGIWDGTFKDAWSNNPAWVFYDMLTHPRYGLGNFIASADVDIWNLYAIAQYCDQMIPDGYGGSEPRFTFNGQITSQQNAYDTLQTLAACFRGMTYWGAGAVGVTADMPGDPVVDVTNADVIDGMFNYVGTPLNSQHTVCYVTWHDPSNLYAATVEVVPNDAAVALYGLRPISIDAVGTTSRGQARRMGKWLLDTEANQGDTVSFSTPLNHLCDLKPGEKFNVVDEFYEGLRFGGRVVSVDSTGLIVTLDSPVALIGDPTATWTFRVLDDTNTVQTPTINLAATGQSATTTITLMTAISGIPPNADWSVQSAVVNPRRFALISRSERAGYIFDFEAVFFDPTKFDRVELNINNVAPNYSVLPRGAIATPTGLVVTEYNYLVGSTLATGLNASWQVSKDPRVIGYEYQYQPPGAASFLEGGTTSAPTADILNITTGTYVVRVRAISPFGNSGWLLGAAFNISNLVPVPGDVTNFTLTVTNSTAYFAWDPVPQDAVCYYEIRYSPTEPATWQTSTVLSSGIRGTQLTAPAADGVFLIKAITDDGSQQSVNAAKIESYFASILETNEVYVAEEDPSWSGTKVQTAVASEILTLASGQTSGTYTTAYFDMGAKYTANVSATILAYGANASADMSNWPTLHGVLALDSVGSTGWSVETQVQYTTDDPGSSGAVWTSPQASFVTGDFTARAFRFLINLASLDGGYTTPQVFSFQWVVAIPNRLEGNNGVSIGTGGATITFSKAFFAVPVVGITLENATLGIYFVLSDVTTTGFSIQALNNVGEGVAATINWIAKGYGVLAS